jgi:hypothetical protein
VTAISPPQASAPPARRAPAPRPPKDPPHGFRDSTIALALFLLASLAMLAGLGGRAANIAFPLFAFATAAVLMRRSPALYSSFCLWIWFLAPFVRRVFDYRHGWNSTNPVLLAPPLVAALSVLTITRHAHELRGRLFAPFLLVLTALGYGYTVGMINAGFIPATYALLTWIAPLMFGVHLALSWRHYIELREAIRKTFAYAVPILAAYGIYQFVRLPVWDAQWMINADLRSIGSPLPFLVRVFGTLNTPGPYAGFLLAGILMQITGNGFIRFPGIAGAALALLLTRTRAAWVAFLIGLAVHQLTQPLVRLPRRIITMVIVAIIAVPLTQIPAFRSTIASRVSTLGSIGSDNSFQKRVQFSRANASEIVETAEGSGLGMTGGASKLRAGAGFRSLDNGFLEIFFLFGWPGGAMFLLGIAALLYQSFQFVEAKRDPFAAAVRATAIALVSILPIGDVFTGSTGTLLWGMMGLSIAAHAYHLTTGFALRSRLVRARFDAAAARAAALGERALARTAAG